LLSPHSHTARRNPAPDLELEQFESTRAAAFDIPLIVVMKRESKSSENASGIERVRPRAEDRDGRAALPEKNVGRPRWRSKPAMPT
jgi:hypothetical protein